MAQLQEQKNEALSMKLRGEVDLATYRAVARERDAAHDQPARERQEADQRGGNAELPDPSLAWDDLSSDDRRALTELLVEEIAIKRIPVRQTRTAVRRNTIRAIPYQDPEMEAERLKKMHEVRVKIVPRI